MFDAVEALAGKTSANARRRTRSVLVLSASNATGSFAQVVLWKTYWAKSCSESLTFHSLALLTEITLLRFWDIGTGILLLSGNETSNITRRL